jgi:hypothetical protein
MDISGVDEFYARFIEATESMKMGGIIRGYASIDDTDSPYTATTSQSIIGCDSSSGAITINLPAAASATAGFCFKVKDEAGSAGTNNITLDPNGSETIDGETTVVMNSNFQSITIYTNGSNWFIE